MKHRLLFTTIFAFGALGVQGGLITTPPAGGTTTVFAGGPGCAGGTDSGFTIIDVSGPVCWPNSTSFGFSNNGYWNNPPAGFGLIGANTETAAFMINLGGLYSSAGGFINYDSPGGIGVDDPTISAIAADGVTVLATYDIAVLAPINTPNGVNAGAFVGIQDATADIAFLEFSNDYVAIHSITLAGAASTVPEPSGVLLLGSGLALVMAVRRRRK